MRSRMKQLPFLLIVLLIGILIYYDVLYTLNQYGLQTGFVQNIIIGGEEWIKNVFIG